MREVSSSSVITSTDVQLKGAEGQQTGVIVGTSVPLVVIVGLMLLALTLLLLAMNVRKRRRKIVEDTLMKQGLGK